MIPFLNREKKQQRKMLEHAMFAVKYARRMKEDLLDEKTLAALRSTYADLRRRVKGKDFAGTEAVVEAALGLAARVHPAPNNAYGLRENVEVFLVVIAVALGFRTYFFQPYQIPTGSMQPTLYGITAVADYQPDWTDKVPVRYVKFLLSGSRYKEVRAKENGIYPGRSERSKADTFYLVGIGGKSHKIHQDYAEMVKPGNPVKKGDLLAKGLLKQGDHIIVNRISTNFRKPRRGEIVVFSTKGLPHVRVNSAYIKRLTGMPGEKITICNGKLYADGQLVEAPDVFVRQYTGRGYDGYLNAGLLPTCQESLVLGEDEFLFMGDNTSRSLDGRFFGGAPGKNIIGTAFFVPWPFVNRGIYGENAGAVR